MPDPTQTLSVELEREEVECLDACIEAGLSEDTVEHPAPFALKTARVKFRTIFSQAEQGETPSLVLSDEESGYSLRLHHRGGKKEPVVLGVPHAAILVVLASVMQETHARYRQLRPLERWREPAAALVREALATPGKWHFKSLTDSVGIELKAESQATAGSVRQEVLEEVRKRFETLVHPESTGGHALTYAQLLATLDPSGEQGEGGRDQAVADEGSDQRFERIQRGLEDLIEAEVSGVVEQRDALNGRLGRIRAAAESDADLAKLPALRDFLLAEADLPVTELIGLVPDTPATDPSKVPEG